MADTKDKSFPASAKTRIPFALILTIARPHSHLVAGLSPTPDAKAGALPAARPNGMA